MKLLLSSITLFVCLFLHGQIPEGASFHLNLDKGLDAATVSQVFTDNKNQIWIGTTKSIHVFDGYDCEKLYETNARSLFFGYAKNNIIATTTHEILLFSEDGGLLQKQDVQQIGFNYFEIIDEKILLKSDSLVEVYDFDLNLIRTYQKSKKNERIFKRETLFGSIYFGYNGAHLIRQNDTVSLSDQFIVDCKVWKQNKLILATDSGLELIKLDSFGVHKRSLWSGTRCEHISIDKNDNVWLATSESGLFGLHQNLLDNNFLSIKTGTKLIDCWRHFKYFDQVVLCSSKGLKLYNDKGFNWIEEQTKHLSILSGIQLDHKILVGTKSNGIYLVDSVGCRLIFKDNNFPLNNTIIGFVKIENRIVAYSKHGLINISLKGGLIDSFKYPNSDMGYIMDITPTHGGSIVCCTKGCYKADEKLNYIHPILEANRVYANYYEKGEKAFLATTQHGLYEKVEDEWIQFLKDEKTIYSAVLDQQDVIWAIGHNKLFRKDNNAFVKLDYRNGFPLKEFSQGGLSQFSDSLFISGIGGSFHFTSDKINLSKHLIKPELLLNNELVNLDKESSKPIILSYDNSNIDCYINPHITFDQNLYEITLIHENEKRAIEKPGSYSFQKDYGSSEITINIKNIISGKSRSYRVEIIRPKPFWLTFWFKCLSIFLLGLLILGGYFFLKFINVNRKLKIKETEEKLMSERFRISRELHDNIGARLTHIISSIDIQMYKNEHLKNDFETINSFAKETMDELRQTIWAVGDKTINASQLWIRLSSYFERLQDMGEINLSYQMDDIGNDDELEPSQTINTFRIVQEAVNNALKYADAVQIKVTFDRYNGKLRFIISDNGVGFNLRDAAAKGNGINSMQTRSEEMNAILKVDSNPSKGTEITLILS